MAALRTFVSAIYVMQISVAALLAILFLQSGIGKMLNRRGNLEWLKGHFAKSPLAGFVPALLSALTILHVAAGVLSGLGCVLVLVLRDSTVAFCGAVISAAAIIALFFRQRLARYYAGGAVLVPYFLLALVSIYLLVPG
jgi:hypothetical protein